jgi:hypothetical protein
MSVSEPGAGSNGTALIYLTHHANGSATLMRGKSRTCINSSSRYPIRRIEEQFWKFNS